MAGNPQETDKGEAADSKRRLWSSPSGLAAAAVTGAGALTSVFLATNRNLTGWHFLAALLLAVAALLLMVEAFKRAEAKVAWIKVGALGVLLAVASLMFVVIPTDHQATADGQPQTGDGPAPVSDEGSLEFSLRPVEPELMHLAFYKQIPLPKPDEGWSELRRRGGVDVGNTNFRMILANRGTEPISVLNVKVEVLGSKPRPRGTLAYTFSQGDEGIGRLTAVIDQVRPKTIAPVYESSVAALERDERKKLTPYFQTTYILLRPGEVYPVAFSIHAESDRLVHFRLIAEGRSAGQNFVRRSPVYSIVGKSGVPSDERYVRTYALEHFPGQCSITPDSPWYDTRYLYSNPAGQPCPSGADSPEEIPLKDPGEYPSGEFGLDLDLRPDAQKVAVGGVTVGRPPAAQPVASVTTPLLQALGAWSLCVDRWPTPGYWTASWERWGLNVVFAGEASTDCTPRSPSSVHEVELWGREQTIDTDDGAVTVGVEPAKVPAAIKASATIEANPAESEVLVRGVSSCDPGRPTDRAQIVPGRPAGGILALHVKRLRWFDPRGQETTSTEIDRAVTTLPGNEC